MHVDLGKKTLKATSFLFKLRKVGTIVTVELPDSFMRLLEITPLGREIFIVNREKEKMNAFQFSLWFTYKAKKAGIKKSAYGVRKLSATISAEEGATTHELMDGYGWKTVLQAEVYTKGTERVRLGIKNYRLIASKIGC
ncbi:hypothetical protein [Candidatus Liberibacter solanacearum]|uniref:hypothetical protein n=1 Tax=Candidatus Liberibacter solanacearum TaxID=556287 RepID=UPI001FDF4AAB|nr:hypothetical protein [Candidatus Liberibacter solanacearum]